MKTNRCSFLKIAVIICGLYISACTKEKTITAPGFPIITPPPVYQSPTRLVWTLDNQYIAAPADSAMLLAYATINNNNKSYLWRKLAGPASYSIQNPDSLKTKVNHLQEGEYKFEITAINSMNARTIDSMYVYLIKPGANEVIFKNLKWGCPLGCSISVPNISTFIPNKPITVFVRPNGSSSWLPVIPSSQWNSSNVFVYDMYNTNNTLLIYVDDASGIVDVKIEY